MRRTRRADCRTWVAEIARYDDRVASGEWPVVSGLLWAVRLLKLRLPTFGVARVALQQ